MNGELGRIDNRVKELERKSLSDPQAASAAASGYNSPRRREEVIVYTPRGTNRHEPPSTYLSPRHSPRGVRSAYETYSAQDYQPRSVYHTSYQASPRSYQVASPRVVYSMTSPVQKQQQQQHIVNGTSHIIQPLSTSRGIQQSPYNVYHVA